MADATGTFCGVEGGGTNTIVVILNGAGKVLARHAGAGCNGWLLGVPRAAEIVVELARKCKSDAGIPLDIPFNSLVRMKDILIVASAHASHSGDIWRAFDASRT